MSIMNSTPYYKPSGCVSVSEFRSYEGNYVPRARRCFGEEWCHCITQVYPFLPHSPSPFTAEGLDRGAQGLDRGAQSFRGAQGLRGLDRGAQPYRIDRPPSLQSIPHHVGSALPGVIHSQLFKLLKNFNFCS